MTFEERLSLLMEMKRKKIKQFEVAQFLEVSNSAVSQFFTKCEKSINDDKVKQMKSFINNYKK